MKKTKKPSRASRMAAPACWAVYFTHTWGSRDERKQSIDLTYQECREHLRLLRKLERQSKMGHRYVMRRLPNSPLCVTAHSNTREAARHVPCEVVQDNDTTGGTNAQP
jgi:hypothetical protein